MVFTIVILSVAGVVLILLLLKSSIHLHALRENGINNDDRATETFRNLVRRMREEILIHDDGERGSFYDDPEVVGLIKSRLQEGCRVRCLFNQRNTSLRLLELQGWENFEVQYTPKWFLDEADLHYKIVDGGRLVYLSRHRSDGDREFELFDCSRSPRRLRPRMFAKQSREFEDLMAVAAMEQEESRSPADALPKPLLGGRQRTAVR